MNLVPSILFNISGMSMLCEPGPVPPMRRVFPDLTISSIVLGPANPIIKQTGTLLLGAPTQPNLRASNFTLTSPMA